VASPIQEAFGRLIEEIYWIESLEEAERVLGDRLEALDPDLREILLEERKKLCNDPNIVIEIIRLEALADSAEAADLKEVLLLRSLLDMLFLVQCSPKWAEMGPREKAHVLAPLYKAWHGLKLALKNYPNSVDRMHLNIAYTMAEEAYERADKLGLIHDVYKLLERLSEEILKEAGENGDGQ
ncbi:MAG: hypothetical protein F7C34_05355, partial [Desulfurococcales archaeon]|nr:hypothetical protein [Desulfurococcales archaeon]